MQTVTNLTANRSRGNSGRSIIGIHTMEVAENPRSAESVANAFQDTKRKASSHWCVDNDSRVRVVNDDDTAWTLPGANSRSLNIEIAGYARQTPEDWADEYTINALEIAAICASEWCVKYDIPVRHLTDAQIRSGAKGFAGHVDVNRVYKQSTHWDPGPSFPWDYFLGRVNAHLNGQGGIAPDAPPAPAWNNGGYSQSYIKARQGQLNLVGYNLEVDGIRGALTIAAIKDFQASHGLEADGLPGPLTVAKLDEVINTKPATARPNCVALQQAVRTAADNAWGADTDKNCDAVREASRWGGFDYPWGKAFTQRVCGAVPDGIWGPNSVAAHDTTVAAMQRALNDMGFNAGAVDTIWGPQSEAAYQAARNACHI